MTSQLPGEIVSRTIEDQICIYRRNDPTTPLRLSQASAQVLDALENVVAERRSRVLLTWPLGLDDIAIFHSLAALRKLPELDTRGLATVLFPWSLGTPGLQRATLVDRKAVLKAIKPALSAVYGNPTGDYSFVLGLHSLAHIGTSGKSEKRLNKALERDASAIEPSLFEVMPQGAARANGHIQTFQDQFLRRVRRHTWFGERGDRLDRLSTGSGSPFFLVGIHHNAIHAKPLKALGFDPRIGGRTPDLVILDLTKRARRRLAEKWKDAVRRFLALIGDVYGDTAPPILAISDDVFVANELRFRLVRDYDVRRRSRSNKDRAPSQCNVVLNPEQDIFGCEVLAAGARVKNVNFEAYGSELLRIQMFGYRLRERLNAVSMPEEFVEAVRAAGFVLQNLMALPGSPRQLNEFLHDNYSGYERNRIGTNYDHLRVRGLLKAGVETGFAGPHQSDLLSFLAAFDKVCAALSSDSPGWTYFDRELRLATQRSSRTIIVLRSETVRSFVDWRIEHDPTLDDIRATLQRKLLLVSKREANQQLDLGALQRHFYSTLLFIEPFADDLLHVLTNRWLPERVRVLSSIAGAEQVKRRIDALLDIEGIDPVRPVLETVLKEANAAVEGHLTDIPDIEREPNLNKVSAIDLTAGGSIGNGRRRTIVTEGGLRILAFERTEFAAYDPDSAQTFARKLARDLVAGDQIFAIDPEFVLQAKERLNVVARASMLLPQYHAAVASAALELSGDSMTEKSETLRSRMVHLEPDIDLPTNQALRSWIDVAELVQAPSDEVRPNAPRLKKQFMCFARALGLGEDLAQLYWDFAIFQTRSVRIQSGAAFHQILMGILIDPYSVAARLPEGVRDEIWRLHEAAEAHIVTVANNSEDSQ